MHLPDTRLVWVTSALAVLALLCAGPAGARSAAPAGDPWETAAQKLSMPVFRPTVTFGMTLRRLEPRAFDCGDTPIEQVDAFEKGARGRQVRIVEARPFGCGDLGDVELVKRPVVRGKRASLYRYCEGNGCSRAVHPYALYWKERGLVFLLISRGLTDGQLVKFAVGLREVAEAPPSYQCSDGADNDGDGKTDFPADPGCASASDADETDVSTNPYRAGS